MVCYFVLEFYNWKSNLEKETQSMFVRTSSCKKRKDHVVYYFYCHRSYLGKKHEKKTAHKEKNAGSNKMSKSCPAMMKAISTNGAVKVEYCSTHFGHECDMGRLRLSIDDRNLLAGMQYERNDISIHHLI